MIQYILLDIEGTTTPIAFVHQVLFPYSRRFLPDYVRTHGSEAVVKEALAATQSTVREEEGRDLGEAEAVTQLLTWIDQDRKHPALKTLQGLIWEHGYAAGSYTSEIYPDVLPALTTWKERGLKLGIYSSGSVKAQVLLFQHTAEGDLTPLLSDYFDTAVGGKRAPASYRTILSKLGRPAATILFLSDVPEELDAAREAGMQTTHIVRPGTIATARHPTAADFTCVDRMLRTAPFVNLPHPKGAIP